MTFEEFMEGKEPLLQEAILLEMQETLTLDFKGAAYLKPGALFTADGKITKDGRRSIAKALSAFSNSAGGVLVIGVDCRSTPDGNDCAQSLDPVPSWEIAVSALNSALGDLIQPKSDLIRVAGFASSEKPGFGYLFVDIPRSERRPHM